MPGKDCGDLRRAGPARDPDTLTHSGNCSLSRCRPRRAFGPTRCPIPPIAETSSSGFRRVPAPDDRQQQIPGRTRSAAVALPCSLPTVMPSGWPMMVHSPPRRGPGRWRGDAATGPPQGTLASGAPARTATRSRYSGHPVGRGAGIDVERTSSASARVGPVHGGLMQSAPDPPAGGSRADECPHRGVGTVCSTASSRARVRRSARRSARPGRRAASAGNRSGIDEFGGSIGNDLCAPTVTTADVAHQLIQRPLRARRHRGRRIGLTQQVGEAFSAISASAVSTSPEPTRPDSASGAERP